VRNEEEPTDSVHNNYPLIFVHQKIAGWTGFSQLHENDGSCLSVADIDAGRFRAFQRVGSDWGKIMHEKPLNRTAPAVLQSASGQEELQHPHDGVGTVHVRAMDTENIVPPHHVV
jgi:hypothetical protein